MRRAVVVGSCIISFLTSSCAAYHNHPPTMEADPPLTGAEGLALINQLQQAFVVSDNEICRKTLPQHQEYESLSYGKYANGKQQVPSQFSCITYKHPAPGDVARHLDAGFALTDLYCNIFFRRVALHNSGRRFARGIVNDVGAAMSAVLGLTTVSSAITGGVGAGFGLADSSFRNYDEAFLVSADLPTLQGKVLSEQEKYKAATAKKNITTFPQANSEILGYANMCSYVGMRGLINASLSETTDGPAALRRMLTSVRAWMAVRQELTGTTPVSNTADPLDDGSVGERAVDNSALDDQAGGNQY